MQHSISYFDRRFILELATVFGLFNYFDYKYLIESDQQQRRSANFKDCLENLKKINEKMYPNIVERFNDFASFTKYLFEYNLSLANLDMHFESARNDFMKNAKTLLEELNFDKKHFLKRYKSMEVVSLNKNKKASRLFTIKMYQLKFMFLLLETIDFSWKNYSQHESSYMSSR